MFKEFSVCHDDSVRGHGEIQKVLVPTFGRRLGEEAQATPRRPTFHGRVEGRDSEAHGGFLGLVKGVGV